MTVLITGATGFVGQYMMEYLTRKSVQVYGLSRKSVTDDRILKGDITDRESLDRIVQLVKPDRIIHLAAFSSVKKSFEDPALVQSINVEGTRNLVSSLEKYTPQARLLYVSSATVYAPSLNPLSENSDVSPNSPYAASRIAAENVLKTSTLDYVIARSFNHTGPRQITEYVLPDWCKQAAAIALGLQQPIVQVGNTDVVRDFLDVRDIVNIYWSLLEHALPREIYNVGSGQGQRLGDLLNYILSSITVPVQIVTNTTKVRQQDSNVLVSDCKKLRAIMQESYVSYTINQTLQDMLSYWRHQLNIPSATATL